MCPGKADSLPHAPDGLTCALPARLPPAFWLSWMTVEVIASVIFSLLLIGFGAMFGFSFFTGSRDRHLMFGVGSSMLASKILISSSLLQ